jgi:DNA invertase Pin-like site-specific DNA recombinase
VRGCAIYARYSSDLQSPTSIDDQVRLCRAYADAQGWTVVRIFEDRALSGFASESRQGYQELLAAALGTTSPFDVILVEDLGRLTRNTGEALRLYQRLQLKGIEIVGVSDGIQTNQRGAKVHLTIKGLTNELYLDDLRDKTHRGLTGAFLRGLSAGGRILDRTRLGRGQAGKAYPTGSR